jgi:DNA polymerase
MFTEPRLLIDKPLLEKHLKDVREQKEKVLDSSGASREELMSNPKFAEVLKSFGVVPPTKISARTGKEALAFAKSDEGFRALLEHPDLRVQILVSARLKIKSTIEETRTARFIEIAGRGPLPIPLRYYAAHTGRWGGDDKINLQNLPRASVIKNALIAPSGHVVIDSDSSQIEARTLAWLAEQDDLTAAFAAGDDVYKIMAAKIYKKDEADITKAERFVGKTTILGCGYGMGAVRFRAQLAAFEVEVSETEAEAVIYTYRKTYGNIPKLWQQADRALNLMLADMETNLGLGSLIEGYPNKGLKLPNELWLRYPNLREHTEPEDKDSGPNRIEIVYDTKRGASTTMTKLYGGKVVENVCQALARIIIGEQMLHIAQRYKVVTTVHDAVTCVVPEEEQEEAVIYIEKCMRTAPAWAPSLPLNCETGVGLSYGGCK